MIEIIKVHPTKKSSKSSNRSKSSSPGHSVKNAYEAGAAGRRLSVWRPGMIGPNQAILRDLSVIRDRSRDSVRNNAWISRGVDSWVTNEVGCGITFKSAAPNEDFRKRADELWERQGRYFDADGLFDFNGLLGMIVRTRRAAGEIFIRRRLRKPGDGLPVPLQYQLLEPEFCPHTENKVVSNGRTIRAGIEFDGIGRRRAYWMHRKHPGDSFIGQSNDMELVPVPASSIIHHYKALRPGQIRGVPAIVQALIKAKVFDEYDDAELVRKRDKSAYTGFIAQKNFPGDESGEWLFNPLTGESLQRDAKGVPIVNSEPGQFILGLPGEEPHLFDGDNTGAGYSDFVRQALMGVAAGQNVPYEFLSGDFSKLNDRTLRVVLAEYHRAVEQDRWQLTIPQVCYTIWKEFIDIAVLVGALPEPPPKIQANGNIYVMKLDRFGKYVLNYTETDGDYYKVACHPEGWPYLHELQDANADIARLKAGLTSRKRILSEEGNDVREVDAERKEDAERSKQMSLTDIFDGSEDDKPEQLEQLGA